MTKQRWCVCAGVLAGAVAAVGAPPSVPLEPLLQAVWAKKQQLAHPFYRLVVVELPKPPDSQKSGQQNLKLRLVADLSVPAAEFKPRGITVAVRISSPHRLFDRPSASNHYLGMALRQNVKNAERWHLNPLVQRRQTVDNRRTYQQTYLLALDKPDDPRVGAIRTLVLGQGGNGKSSDAFERTLQYVAGPDERLRDFAASFAAVAGIEVKDDENAAERKSAFARLVLGHTDRDTRRRLARAYSSSKRDVLGSDAELLAALFGHEDEAIFTPVLRDNLRKAGARAEALAPLLRPLLRASEGHPERRWCILKAMTGWKEHALVLRDALDAIALGTLPGPPRVQDRLLALQILLDNEVADAAALIEQTAASVPSAVALDYAVRHRVTSVVPAVIEAVRAEQLAWSATHAAALALLTCRFPDGEFEDFDGWWHQVEQAGTVEENLRGGFCDATTQARVARLVEQLGSPRYAERVAAREALEQLDMRGPPALTEAVNSPDAEVARSAMILVDKANKDFRKCSKLLDQQAKLERRAKPDPDGAKGLHHVEW